MESYDIESEKPDTWNLYLDRCNRQEFRGHEHPPKPLSDRLRDRLAEELQIVQPGESLDQRLSRQEGYKMDAQYGYNAVFDTTEVLGAETQLELWAELLDRPVENRWFSLIMAVDTSKVIID